MAHAWFRGFYRNGHDEMGRVNKTNFAKNQKGTISDSFNNAIRNKTLLVLAIVRIRKDDARRNGGVVGRALKHSLKRLSA